MTAGHLKHKDWDPAVVREFSDHLRATDPWCDAYPADTPIVLSQEVYERQARKLMERGYWRLDTSFSLGNFVLTTALMIAFFALGLVMGVTLW